MLNKLRFISVIMVTTLFVNLSFSITSYSENKSFIIEEYSVSEEFSVALTNEGTNSNGSSIDVNEDGILDSDELSISSICLDLDNCHITDWSDLRIFPNLKRLEIINADFNKCSFSWDLNKDKIDMFIPEVTIRECVNCDKISGIEIFKPILNLSFVSNDIISCDTLNALSEISDLSITDCDITDVDMLGDIRITNLTIKSSSVNELGFVLPNINGLETLDMSDNTIISVPGTDIFPLLYFNVSHNNIIDLPEKINQVLKLDLSWNNIENINWYRHGVFLENEEISTNRIINLYGNPLSAESIKTILNYNYNFDGLFIGKVNDIKKIEFNEDSPFKWMDFNKFKLEIEDSSIIKISENTIEFLRPGNTKMYVYYNNGLSEKDTCIVYDATVSDELGNLNNPSILPTDTPSLVGDVNGDNKVDAVDALEILKMSAKIIPEDITLADVNEDGVVNASDALVVLKIAAKIS